MLPSVPNVSTLRLFIVSMLVVFTAGCSKSNDYASTQQATSLARSSEPGARHLAYEHAVSVDIDEGKLASAYAAIQARCSQLVAEGCEVLASRISTGRLPSASLRLRASEKGVETLTSDLHAQGEITEQSTTAEDLDGPISDASKKLAMLTDYRSKLEALQARGGNDLESLIKLNRELAQVQAELEAAAGTKSSLAKRVETHILNVSLSSPRSSSLWRPVANAFSEFGGNLSQAVSAVITAFAYLLPWCVLLAILLWCGRRLWSRRRRPAAET